MREATGAHAVEARPRVEVARPRVEAARARVEAARARAEGDPLVLPDDRAVFVNDVAVAAASSSLSSASSCTRAFLPPAPFLEALPRFRPPLALGGGGGGGGTGSSSSSSSSSELDSSERDVSTGIPRLQVSAGATPMFSKEGSRWRPYR